MKRAIDFSTAAVLLVVLSPLLLIVALLVFSFHGRPILFAQERPGHGGRLFRVRKFRSMRPASENSSVRNDSQRLTPFGRALRATSLDELPQLANILVGQMSFIGPRPLLPEYLPHYSPEQARRHDMRPGLTGLAQVRGRNAAAWSDRLQWDTEYVDRHGLVLDLQILARTVLVVLRRTGVTAHGHATAREFVLEPELPRRSPEAS